MVNEVFEKHLPKYYHRPSEEDDHALIRGEGRLCNQICFFFYKIQTIEEDSHAVLTVQY